MKRDVSALFNFAGFAEGTKPTRNDRRRMTEAVERLSRTETGRYLLERGKALGYDIFYDGTINENHKAQGLCYSDPRDIRAMTDKQIHELALILVHELAHAVYFHDIEIPDLYNTHPNLAVMRGHAMEADAIAHEAVFVIEFAFSCKQDRQYNHLIEHFQTQEPHAAPAAIKAVLNRGKFDDTSRRDVMRAAFDAYYLKRGMREKYEKDFLEDYDWQQSGGGYVNNLALAGQFNRASQGLTGALRHRGHPYLDTDGEAEAVNLNSPYYMGLTWAGKRIVEKKTKDYWVKPKLTEYAGGYVMADKIRDEEMLAFKQMVKDHQKALRGARKETPSL